MLKPKTQASVKDNRLTIFTKDARQPGVTTMALDHATSGQFELNGDEGGTALVFKPAGKKAVETIGVYAQNKEAVRALETVFSALERGRKGGSRGGFWRIVKIVAIIAVVLLLLNWIAGFVGQVMLASQMGDSGAVPAGTVADDQPLPVGEPMLVDEFIERTRDQDQQQQMKDVMQP